MPIRSYRNTYHWSRGQPALSEEISSSLGLLPDHQRYVLARTSCATASRPCNTLQETAMRATNGTSLLVQAVPLQADPATHIARNNDENTCCAP